MSAVKSYRLLSHYEISGSSYICNSVTAGAAHTAKQGAFPKFEFKQARAELSDRFDVADGDFPARSPRAESLGWVQYL
jgi:hypothetical protein